MLIERYRHEHLLGALYQCSIKLSPLEKQYKFAIVSQPNKQASNISSIKQYEPRVVPSFLSKPSFRFVEA